jgi:hypothetical protein
VRALCRRRNGAAHAECQQLSELEGRLRGDVHALTTWLVLARQRIAEAREILDGLPLHGAGAVAIDAWNRRVNNTVFVVTPADIAARSQSSGGAERG